MNLGRLLARAVIGGLFIGHGTQKLFGWFDGPGPDGAAQMMDKVQLHPPRRHAMAGGVTETAGGTLVALGLATPLGAAALTGTMITAIRKVHAKNGPWVTNGGYEYNLVLIAALFALVDGGPGAFSLDRLLGIDDTGPAWALGALAAGAATSAAVIAFGERQARAAAREPSRPDQETVSVP